MLGLVYSKQLPDPKYLQQVSSGALTKTSGQNVQIPLYPLSYLFITHFVAATILSAVEKGLWNFYQAEFTV